jgi:hypothetical protein
MSRTIKQPIPSWIIQRAEERLRDERINRERQRASNRKSYRLIHYKDPKAVDKAIKEIFAEYAGV